MILSRRLIFTAIVLSQILFFIVPSIAQTKVWTRLSGTSGYDIGRDVVVDSRGNVYVTGGAEGAIDGQFWAGSGDICLMKYDSSGTRLWTRLTGSPLNNEGYGIDVDNEGNVYVAGGTQDTLDGQSYAGGFNDICLVKYNSSGTKLWTRLSGSAGMDDGYGVAADSFGNVYVVGTTESSFDGQPFAGNTDICLLKFDSSGTKLWTRLCGTTGIDGGYSVAVDAGGNVYVTGYVNGALDGQAWAGSTDICLLKYDSSGTKLWTRLCGMASSENGCGVSVDAGGNVYVTGWTYNRLDSQPNAGSQDICLLKYDSGGTKQWTRLCGMAGQDYGVDVTVDGGGNVYVTGRASGALDGQPYSAGGDVSVLKYTGGGTRLWTRLCGSDGWDQGQGVGVDGAGGIYVAGVCSGPLDGQPFAGGYDIFLMKFKTAPLTIFSILPDTEAVANSPVHIRVVAGTGFHYNTSVKLCRTGNTDIVAANVVVDTSYTKLSCDFNLTAADTGIWNVVVANADVGTSDTLYQGFTVLDMPILPMIPQLSYPPDDTTRQVYSIRFRWTFCLRAATYECQIAEDSNFTTLVVDTSGLTDTSAILTTPRYDTFVFYWRVRAVNGSGASAWSAVRSYTTGPFSGVQKKNSLTAVNPFDFSVSDRAVRYSLGRTTDVSIRIFDLNGRMIVPIINRTQSAGEYSVSFSDKKLGAGMYLLRFSAGSFEKTQSIAIMR